MSPDAGGRLLQASTALAVDRAVADLAGLLAGADLDLELEDGVGFALGDGAGLPQAHSKSMLMVSALSASDWTRPGLDGIATTGAMMLLLESVRGR